MEDYTEEQLISGLKKAIAAGNLQQVSEIESALQAQRSRKRQNEQTDVLNKTANDLPPFDPATGEYIPEPQETAQPEEEPEWYERAIGVAETGLSLGSAATTGALGGVTGALSGLYDSVKEGKYGTSEGAEDVRQRFQQGVQGLTYTPKTEEGLEYTEAVGEALQPLEAASGLVPQLSVLGRSSKAAIESQRARAPSSIIPGEQSPEKDTSLKGLQESQKVLEEGGGTLTAYQTNQSGAIRNFAERVAQTAITSRGQYAKNRQRNIKTLSNGLNDMIDGIDPRMATSKEDLGQAVFSIIDSGKKAMGRIYDSDLNRIKDRYGDIKINLKPISEAVSDFEKAYTSEDFGKLLDESSNSIVGQVKSRIAQTVPNKKGLGSLTRESKQAPQPTPKASVSSLIDLEKYLNGQINKLGDFNSTSYNSVASRELAQLSSSIRNTLLKTFKESGNEELAKDFSLAKSQFSQGVDAMFPKNIDPLLKGASTKESFEGVGRALVSGQSANKVKSFVNSIDTAFSKLTPEERKNLPTNINSPDKAKQAIRQSYLKNVFGEVPDDPTLYGSKYTKLYQNLTNPSNEEYTRAVLGNVFPRYRKITRAIRDSSAEQGSDTFALALRSAEASAPFQTVQLGRQKRFGSAIASIGSVFFFPRIMAGIVSSKNAVDKLLKFQKYDPSDKTVTRTFLLNQAQEVINSIENEQIREEARGKLKKSTKEEGEEERKPLEIEITY